MVVVVDSIYFVMLTMLFAHIKTDSLHHCQQLIFQHQEVNDGEVTKSSKIKVENGGVSFHFLLKLDNLTVHVYYNVNLKKIHCCRCGTYAGIHVRSYELLIL